MSSKRSQSAGRARCAACGYLAATQSVAFCPDCGRSFVPQKQSRKRTRIGWFSLPQMLYQTTYKWLVLFAAMDVMFTWIILLLGGSEVNVIANAVIASGGLKSILVYKFCLVVGVVLICEVVGRRKLRTGRNLARMAVVITAMPVILSIAQLFN